MKINLLKFLGGAVCAMSLSSCYMYDDPLTWADPCPRPVYGRSFYSPPVYRSYGYSSRACAPVVPRCAPPPPVCHQPFGGFGGFHGHHRGF